MTSIILSKKDHEKFLRINKEYKYTYTEYAKYYNLTTSTVIRLRNPGNKDLRFYHENYKTIQNLLSTKELMPSKYMQQQPVTPEIYNKIKYLKSIYGSSEKLSRDIDVSYTTINSIMRKKKVMLSKILSNTIETLYQRALEEPNFLQNLIERYSGFDSGRRSDVFLDIDSLIKKDKEELLMKNKKNFRPLKLNCKYRIYIFSSNNYDIKTRETEIIIGTVIKEYPKYYILECKNWKTTVLKNDLYTKMVEVVEIKKGVNQ